MFENMYLKKNDFIAEVIHVIMNVWYFSFLLINLQSTFEKPET